MRKHAKYRSVVAAGLAAALVLTLAGPASAGDTPSIWRSILLPGAGQAHQGHYTKAAIFSSAAVLSWVGLFVSQINYDRAVERYDDQKATYLGYQTSLDAGTVVRFEDITGTYADMTSTWDSAEHRYTWRNVFIGALTVTYTANLIDIILSKPETGERSAPVSLDVRADRVMLVREFRF